MESWLRRHLRRPTGQRSRLMIQGQMRSFPPRLDNCLQTASRSQTWQLGEIWLKSSSGQRAHARDPDFSKPTRYPSQRSQCDFVAEEVGSFLQGNLIARQER